MTEQDFFLEKNAYDSSRGQATNTAELGPKYSKFRFRHYQPFLKLDGL